MTKKSFFMVASLLCLVFIPGVILAAAPFYEGKTVRIVVGSAPGGGYDTYARFTARHMSKYVPGSPTIIVENMPGAGSLVAANYLYKMAKPDGLTIGSFQGSAIFSQVFEQPGVAFDARKFQYVGGPFGEKLLFILSKASGIDSWEKWMASKRPLTLGGVGPGGSPDTTTKVIKTALGPPTQLVAGYKGMSDIRLAVMNGELDGSSVGWDSLKVTWSKELQKGDVVVVLQAVPKALPEFSKVPVAINLAKTDEARHLIEVGCHIQALINRPYALPPGTPKEQAQILIKAYHDTLKDKEFLAEAEKAKLTIDPITGEEMSRNIENLFKADSRTLSQLKEILFK